MQHAWADYVGVSLDTKEGLKAARKALDAEVGWLDREGGSELRHAVNTYFKNGLDTLQDLQESDLVAAFEEFQRLRT